MSLLIKALKQAEQRHRDLVENTIDDANAALNLSIDESEPDPAAAQSNQPAPVPVTAQASQVSVSGNPETRSDDVTESSPPSRPMSLTPLGASDQNIAIARHAEPELTTPPADEARPLAAPAKSSPKRPSEASSPAPTSPVATAVSLRSVDRRSRLGLTMLLAIACVATIAWLYDYSTNKHLPDNDDVSTQAKNRPPIDAAFSELDNLSSESMRVRSVVSQTPTGTTNVTSTSSVDESDALANSPPASDTTEKPKRAPVSASARKPVRQATNSKKPEPALAGSKSPTRGARRLAKEPSIRLNKTNSIRKRKNDLLNTSYAALLRGENEVALRGYNKVLETDRNSSDAWIGLATLAARSGDKSQAETHYRRALRINPNDTVARAGLTTLIGSSNLVAQESHLRNLASRKESGAAVQFALGNTLAAQGRWREAQQAYFSASSTDRTQPDYAFNLAVALERIRQPKLAIEHYRRAIETAAARPARFNTEQALARIATLEQISNAPKPQKTTASRP